MWRHQDEKVCQIESSLPDMGASDGSTVDTRRNLPSLRLTVCRALSASVHRDIAIIATRADRLPEALPNPITGDRRIDLYAFPIDPTRQHLNGHLIAISCAPSSPAATNSHDHDGSMFGIACSHGSFSFFFIGHMAMLWRRNAKKGRKQWV